jgi:hypothetical protein
MAQISSSNKPEDVATLAYIWGFPLVTMERQFNFVTNPNVSPGVGHGPVNTLSSNSCARQLINASFTDVVSPNADTLYCFVQFDLKKELEFKDAVKIYPWLANSIGLIMIWLSYCRGG